MNSVQSSQLINKLCRICCIYYGNQNTRYLCSKCYEAVVSYHTFTESLSSKNDSQVFQQPSKQIKKGLLLYPCREPANSRLRLTHSSTFRVVLAKELRKDLLKPAFRKTLKYVRSYQDLRTFLLYQEDYNLKYYYLSSQVIRQLKGKMNVRLLLSENLTKNIFESLLLLISRLKVTNLILYFINNMYFRSKTTCYLDDIIMMIRKMRNLHYIGFRNNQRITFKPDSKTRLLKYSRIISQLTNLTEISLGYCNNFDLNGTTSTFLNHSHLRKIRATISGNEKKYSEAFFQNLGNIKELDYLQIDVEWMNGSENCTIQYHVALVNFLHSVKSIGTLAINDKDDRYLPLDDYTVYPTKLTNVKQIVILGYQFESSLRLIRLTSEAISLQMSLKNQDHPRADAISLAISNNINLKHLAMESDYCSHSFAESLLNKITLTGIITISIDVTGFPSDSPISNQYLHVVCPLINFARRQNELKEISLQLFYPIEFEILRDFLEGLKELPKLELLTIRLKICNEFSPTDKYQLNEFHKFCENLSKLEDLKFAIDLKGNLIITKRVTLPRLEN